MNMNMNMHESEANLSSPAPGGAPGEGDNEPQSMSLLSGVATSEAAEPLDLDEARATTGSRGLSRGTVAVIGIALIAIAAVYGMRLMQGELSADGDAQVEARMEQILAKLGNPDALAEDDPLRPQNMEQLFSDTDAIVASLDTDLTDRQVPSEFVKKNPFKLPIERKVDGQPVDRSQQEREARLARLQSELNRMNLQSVMRQGGTPMAMIDGDMYRPGERVGSFRIESISVGNQTIMLEAEDHAFTLTMGG